MEAKYFGVMFWDGMFKQEWKRLRFNWEEAEAEAELFK